jgi:hypothetical protein
MFFLSNSQILELSNQVFYFIETQNFKKDKISDLLLIQTLLRCVYRELESKNWDGLYLDQNLKFGAKFIDPNVIKGMNIRIKVGNIIVDTYGRGVNSRVPNVPKPNQYKQKISMQKSYNRAPELWKAEPWLTGEFFGRYDFVQLVKTIANEIKLFRESEAKKRKWFDFGW